MKRFLSAVAIMVAMSSVPLFAADVGVSISIGQPGFYGRHREVSGRPPSIYLRR